MLARVSAPEPDQDTPREAPEARRAPMVELAPPLPQRAPEPTPAERLASTIGNRSFSQLVARMADGEGILSGGLVHPDVEGAIAAARGRGRALDRGLEGMLSSAYGDDLGDVRVHTGEQANALARAVSARAFTVGSDIFFADGEYSPRTHPGQDLIAHEVAHVVHGRGAPSVGPLTVTVPGDAHERAAEAAARGVSG
jgi:hypothetical protein